MQVTKENYQWFSHSDIITALQLFFYAYIPNYINDGEENIFLRQRMKAFPMHRSSLK